MLKNCGSCLKSKGLVCACSHMLLCVTYIFTRFIMNFIYVYLGNSITLHEIEIYSFDCGN